MLPAATEWSPPRISGIFAASSVFTTSSACLVQVAVISFRYLAVAWPSFFCSAMATATLPASSTTCPMASSRASRPATRTAEGPISTPRRDCPRSSGTPMTRMRLALGFFSGSGFGAASGLRSISEVLRSRMAVSGFILSFFETRFSLKTSRRLLLAEGALPNQKSRQQ